MESPGSSMTPVKYSYPEEIILEAYNLEWESIELRCQRLQKTWQQLLLMEKMDKEGLRYMRRLRRIKRREQERQAREQIELEQAETIRREREKEGIQNQKRELEKKARRKKVKLVAVSDAQVEEGVVSSRKKTTKPKDAKAKTQLEKTQTTKTAHTNRITPICMPSTQPRDDEMDKIVKSNDSRGDKSPPPELADDGLLDMLSLDKASDSDENDDLPSMVSLILPVQQESPKQAQQSPLKKKGLVPQKRLLRRSGAPPMEFNFMNGEARRQVKEDESATYKTQGADEERDEAETEPEPMHAPPVPTPKKFLRRRKNLNANEATILRNKTELALATKSKIGTANSNVAGAKITATDDASTRENTVGNDASKGPPTQTKTLAGEVGDRTARSLKRTNGKSETMSIKQRLANAELLSRMSKMKEMTTPKVLDKKLKKNQKQDLPKPLAADRNDSRNVLARDPPDFDVYRRDHMIEDGDLNISLNSSGLISDNDSPENLLALNQKRPRDAVAKDVTPTKKLQFQAITKRLVKSPMPRYLRTPTPLMSPAVTSGLIRPKAASPGPPHANVRNPIAARRLNSAPVRSQKTMNSNRFGIPVDSAISAVNGSGFSMFDAFVNSGSSGSIPKLKRKNRDVSPSV